MKPDLTIRWQTVLEALEQFYREVDLRAEQIYHMHAARLQCRQGCRICCVDEITVFEVEAQNIRRHHAALLESGTPYPEGACAFLDQAGGCRVYEHRPYVCRTQGLPLRWVEEGDDGDGIEMRDICPLNEEGEPVVNLWPEQCWEIGPFEQRLAQLQFMVDKGEMHRVILRSLFARHRPKTGKQG